MIIIDIIQYVKCMLNSFVSSGVLDYTGTGISKKKTKKKTIKQSNKQTRVFWVRRAENRFLY